MNQLNGALYYTVTGINGDYAQLLCEDGRTHGLTMFLLPEGTQVGSRLRFQDFAWTLLDGNPHG